VEFGLKYFLCPPDGRPVVQEFSYAGALTVNSWFVLFAAGIPLKTALVIRRVKALGIDQTIEHDYTMLGNKVSILIHEGPPTVAANKRLTSTAFREASRIIWPVPMSRDLAFNTGEPPYNDWEGPLVIGADDNRYVVIALRTAGAAVGFRYACANVDSWYIPDPENTWKGNL